MSTKKKIRDLERLLWKKGDTLPPHVVADKKKLLETLRGEHKNKQKMAKAKKPKYKRIMFVEKRKVLRKIKSLQSQLSGMYGDDEEKAETVRTQLEQYNDYLLYVNNFPEGTKYVSLFPAQDTEEGKTQREAIMAKLKGKTVPVQKRGIMGDDRTKQTDQTSQSDDDDDDEDESIQHGGQDPFFMDVSSAPKRSSNKGNVGSKRTQTQVPGKRKKQRGDSDVKPVGEKGPLRKKTKREQKTQQDTHAAPKAKKSKKSKKSKKPKRQKN